MADDPQELLTPADPQELLAAADAVMRRAHVPYSGFSVGAALRGAGGAIHTGANVENASYSQTQCAEASAIGVMVAAGETRIAAVAIVAKKLEHCPPCGGCRQRLSEFADAGTPVYLGRPGSEPLKTTLGELLPLAFGAGALGSGATEPVGGSGAPEAVGGAGGPDS